MNLADKLSALKSVIAAMSQQQAFLEACGVNTKAPDFDLPKAIKTFEMHHIPHTMIALMVSEAFEGGNHFNGSSFFPDRKSKSKTCQFMIHLTMTAFDLSECYDQALGGWKKPSVRDALHHALSEYFGPVALSFNAPPKSPDAAKKPPVVRVNPYISTKNAKATDKALTVETVEDLTPTLSHLTLEPIPPPQRDLVETLFEIITPWMDPTSTGPERNAVLWPAMRHLLIQCFTVDPHIQFKRYPGSEDMPNEYTLMTTIHRGTPVSQWPSTVWKAQKFFAENFYVHKSGDPQRTKLLNAHAVPAEEIMAFINPPPVPEGPLLEPPPRSMAWTLSVAPLQTVAPVSVAFLHGTVKRTNAKELQEAIMSHTVWKGCDIKIVLKSGQLKKSPREELTRETAAFGMIVFCAAKDYHQCLQKLSQIYLATVKSGFPLDRKYTVIPDMCSPCFTDHSSDECIPVLETYRTSQVATTKDVHEITLTGVSSLHTELSETHPGVTLNKYLMSLKMFSPIK